MPGRDHDLLGTVEEVVGGRPVETCLRDPDVAAAIDLAVRESPRGRREAPSVYRPLAEKCW